LRKLLAGLILGAGAACLVVGAGALGWLDVAELKTYDWRTRRIGDAAAVDRDIVLVEINDTTLRDLEPAYGRWPWPRVAFSTLLDFLERGHPRVIAVDLAFIERQSNLSFTLGEDTWTGAESDQALVDTVAAHRNVILLADAVYGGTVDAAGKAGGAAAQANATATWHGPPYRLGPAIEERPLVSPPFQALADAAAGLAHNYLPLDPDGPARRMPPFIRVGDQYLPSLGVAAALMAAGVRPEEVVLDGNRIRIRDRIVPLVATPVRDAYDPSKTHLQRTMLIRYRAPALDGQGNRPFPSYEARHLMVSEAQLGAGETPLVDPAVFADKVVFVGLAASGLVDAFQTPFGSQGTMPGVQLHASMAQSILRNDFVRPAGRLTDVAATAGGALAVGLLSAWLPFAAALGGTLLLLGGWTWYAAEAFRGGLWVALAQPLAAMAATLFAGTAYQYFVEDREKRKVKRLFGRYVSRDVYDQLLANPALAELGGARREMTVLFSDIRGFTAVTEKGDPEALVAQLNAYFSRMVDIVFRHQGTIDKFIGDSVMALFGAPVDDVHHAEHAVEVAEEMVRELGLLNREWAAAGGTPLDIGIGINSGDMIAGNIGSSAIMSYTVIGDNVNLAARLESLNKDFRSRIIISDATRVRLTAERTLRPLGSVVVKGKTQAVSIFEVVVPSPALPEDTHP
jgi:adenylate cyclase